ncbi:MAG: hypothetical protein OXF42_05550 [Candidatus Dadabacteria bacterium]|nr:hypothetical protein [Candidatus Dadabacteria bacterium]
MRAILIRVAIDQTADSGNWNAPCNPQTGDFVYVPIKQTKTANLPGMEKRYADLIVPVLDGFSKRNNCDIFLPECLTDQRMHLDPDFENLTYGDTARRGKNLLTFREDDLVVFFASLRPVTKNELVYALIGLLTVEDISPVKDISASKRDENAHTRNSPSEPTDIVVRGKKGKSGRFARYIRIGEYREGAYRVTKPLLEQWGGLSVKNGYLQRSATPPLFLNAERFYNWLQNENPRLLHSNNP